MPVYNQLPRLGFHRLRFQFKHFEIHVFHVELDQGLFWFIFESLFFINPTASFSSCTLYPKNV